MQQWVQQQSSTVICATAALSAMLPQLGHLCYCSSVTCATTTRSPVLLQLCHLCYRNSVTCATTALSPVLPQLCQVCYWSSATCATAVLPSVLLHLCQLCHSSSQLCQCIYVSYVTVALSTVLLMAFTLVYEDFGGRFLDESIPACSFFFPFFFQWRRVYTHQFHSLSQCQSTVAHQANTTVVELSLLSCVRAHFPDMFPHCAWTG